MAYFLMPYRMEVTGYELTQCRLGWEALNPSGPELAGQLLYSQAVLRGEGWSSREAAFVIVRQSECMEESSRWERHTAARLIVGGCGEQRLVTIAC